MPRAAAFILRHRQFNEQAALIKKGDQLFKNNQYREAQKYYSKCLGGVYHGFVLTQLGFVSRNLGDQDGAREYFNQALAEPILDTRSYLNIANFFSAYEEYDEAIKITQKALRHNSRNFYCFQMLLECYAEQDNFKDAEIIVKRGCAMTPHPELLLRGYVRYLLKKNDGDSAQRIIEEMRSEGHLNKKSYKDILIFVKRLNKKAKGEVEKKKEAMSITKHNYMRLKRIVKINDGTLVSVQYPTRAIAPLKKMLESDPRVIYVDNEEIFNRALKKVPYGELFYDSFGGTFGHCTRKGNLLIAHNIARAIIESKVIELSTETDTSSIKK